MDIWIYEHYRERGNNLGNAIMYVRYVDSEKGK